MSYTVRKSFRVVPGVRLNLSKRGLGLSVSAKVVRYSVCSSSAPRRSSAASHARANPFPAPSAPPTPGLLAPKEEKDLFKAIRSGDRAGIRRVADATVAPYAPILLAQALAGFSLVYSEPVVAIAYLQRPFTSGQRLEQNAFATKYLDLTSPAVPITIADGVGIDLPLCHDAVGLALAEAYQAASDLRSATNVVEGLELSAHVALSLAELYIAQDRFDNVIDLTNGLSNIDDITALLLVYRGMALATQGLNEAAREAYKQATRSRAREPQVRHLALVQRALTYQAEGKKSMARKDLEKVLAEDANYPGVRELLAQLDMLASTASRQDDDASAATVDTTNALDERPNELPGPGESMSAGWYSDPWAESAHRWWDGDQWTGHVDGHSR